MATRGWKGRKPRLPAQPRHLHEQLRQVRQVSFRQPVVQRHRQEKHLVRIAVAKLFAHAPMLQRSPRVSTQK